MRRAATIAMVWLTGCFFDGASPPPPPLEGEIYRYVVSDLKVPLNNSEAREFGLDLNNDGTVDNQLGMVFGTLEGQGLGVGGTAREALLRGGLVMLAELQTTSFEDTEVSGLTTFLGSDPIPNACLDEADLATCGQHLKGDGEFTIDPDTASHQALGPIIDGVFLDTTGVMPVEIAINPASPIRLDLRGARVKLTQITESSARGVLSGAIAPIDIDGVVIPEAAAQIDRIVVAECGKPNGYPPCGCLGRSRTLQNIFDVDDNCRVDTEEVAENSLVMSLLSPDVRVHGMEMLSFGVGVELVRATF